MIFKKKDESPKESEIEKQIVGLEKEEINRSGVKKEGANLMIHHRRSSKLKWSDGVSFLIRDQSSIKPHLEGWKIKGYVKLPSLKGVILYAIGRFFMWWIPILFMWWIPALFIQYGAGIWIINAFFILLITVSLYSVATSIPKKMKNYKINRQYGLTEFFIDKKECLCGEEISFSFARQKEGKEGQITTSASLICIETCTIVQGTDRTTEHYLIYKRDISLKIKRGNGIQWSGVVSIPEDAPPSSSMAGSHIHWLIEIRQVDEGGWEFYNDWFPLSVKETIQSKALKSTASHSFSYDNVEEGFMMVQSNNAGNYLLEQNESPSVAQPSYLSDDLRDKLLEAIQSEGGSWFIRRESSRNQFSKAAIIAIVLLFINVALPFMIFTLISAINFVAEAINKISKPLGGMDLASELSSGFFMKVLFVISVVMICLAGSSPLFMIIKERWVNHKERLKSSCLLLPQAHVSPGETIQITHEAKLGAQHTLRSLEIRAWLCGVEWKEEAGQRYKKVLYSEKLPTMRPHVTDVTAVSRWTVTLPSQALPSDYQGDLRHPSRARAWAVEVQIFTDGKLIEGRAAVEVFPLWVVSQSGQ